MGDSSNVGAGTTKKSNKIRDIVRLQQMLKKWKKAATASSTVTNCNVINVPTSTTTTTTTTKAAATTKGLNKFLKKTLSFSDLSSSSSSSCQEDVVRKGYLAVWVGRKEEEMKKFVIPTDYLAHQAFSVLLRDAEEEFGFQQEGILKIPCDIPLFEKILKMMSSSSSSADNNKKHQQQQQHPKQHGLLKSSSSTSSFFLYDHQQPTIDISPSPTHQQQLKISTPPPTPTHHLPLYCR